MNFRRLATPEFKGGARLIEAGRNRASNHSPIVDGASSAEE